MKTCSRCNTPVSDEYKYCLNCGNVLERSSDQEPLPTLVYHAPVATPPTVAPTIANTPQAGSAGASSSLSNNSSRRSSRLPWLIVGGCLVTIIVLAAIIAIQRRAAVSETVATAPTNEVTSTPTPAASAEVLVPNTNQPTPVGSVSPLEKKEPTPTPTPVASANVRNPQSQPSPTARRTEDSSLTPPAPRDEPPLSPLNGDRVYSIRDVTEKARILYKPQPSYSEEARQNNVEGVVVLRVILSAQGTIVGVSVISGLPYGLTERAIAAARQIKFTPAQKDGVPVTVAMQLEYKFNIY